MRRWLILPLLAAVLGAQPPPAKLRDPNMRNITGTVMKPDKSPVPGAIVKLKNLKTLQVLSYIVQEDGKYRFNNLGTAIDYEVRAETEDMISKKRSLSVFDQRLDAVLDLKLKPRKKDKNDKDQPAK